MPEDIDAVRAELATLKTQLAPLMNGAQTFREGMASGTFTIERNSAQRTDTAAADGEVNAYVSGSTIRLQMFDADAAVWREVTLS